MITREDAEAARRRLLRDFIMTDGADSRLACRMYCLRRVVIDAVDRRSRHAALKRVRRMREEIEVVTIPALVVLRTAARVCGLERRLE